MWLICRYDGRTNSLFKFVTALLLIFSVFDCAYSLRKYTRKQILSLREEVRDMFQHAYNGYLTHASQFDELRPLSCDGVDTWGSYSLTLIDSLDTLAVMGNFTEFRRVVDFLVEHSNFDSDINVSVFETNIRIVGGLLGAHLQQYRSGAVLEPGWPCNGPLLRLAEDVAKRLLPAFDTKTGMPYGTVNLKYGVPENETTITCAAGVGTFIVEFGALSRLTGDPIYEDVALNAIHALYKHRSQIGLYGNHIDVQTGRWTGVDSGIGAGVDSFYEYLVKGAIMLNRPELMQIFNEGKMAIDKYLNKNDWHVWASMTKGQVTIPVFQSLDAYWPGVLSMLGDIPNAMKSIYNYHSVWKQYGFLPEFYNIPNTEAGANREGYPLRPELIESVMYLYRATGDSYLLEVGEDMLRSIQNSAKTSCGYATIKNVRDHRKENRMESFFLAETTKYLYLLFDPDHYLNNNGGIGTIINTPNGECIIDAGGYVFNTEAHPIDPSALRCCYEMPRQQLLADNYDRNKYLGDIVQISLKEDPEPITSKSILEESASEDYSVESEITRLTNLTTFNVNQLFSTDEAKNELLKFLYELKFSSGKKDDTIETNADNIESPANPTTLVNASDSVATTNASEVHGANATENIQTVTNATSQIKIDKPIMGGSIEIVNEVQVDQYAKGASEDEKQQRNLGTAATVSPASTVKTTTPPMIVPPKVTEKPPDRQPFDAQRLLERIRMMYKDESVARNYELLSCEAQSYSQRLAVLGEIIT